ncbi:potassium transporter Trk [Phytoactinopolyspora limicola]|uniref:potassium transporter Trk n=1 Tax=Phytoactinopolyspora limicola TaxID=2715536 RepID=UPI00140CCEAB|nr:potassium transporter Trk [Phytoactinopolyspora limicola]
MADNLADVVFVLIGIAFFTACVGYVRGCDRIIGPDQTDLPADTAQQPSHPAPIEVSRT